MKVLKLYYPEELIKLPREDAWAVDEKNKVFAVADGVHLQRGIEYKSKYPRPSPAGMLAQKFCAEFIKKAKRGSLRRAFGKANKSAFVFNKNRDKFSVFESARCYYAATAAFMRMRGKYIEYGYICDACVGAVATGGRLLFFKQDHDHHHGFDLSRHSVSDSTYLLRTIFRNALGPRGEKMGYGVVTGEKEAEAYVHYGRVQLRKEVVYFAASDGFEAYIPKPEFRKALFSMDKERIEKTISRLHRKNSGNRQFLSEKTLIAAKI